ncbi:DHH family phosphoesterase [Peribacillus sp. SCS-26]|uniref:DHH family phosphoesterase n=1 Tax=Paraperibacillus marinus TaxID=3115295 RepID=UPI0039064577
MKAEILKTIQEYETIILHRHVRPDPDAYGSQGGLAEILRVSYPDKAVYAVGQEEESLAFLAPLDAVPDEIYEGALIIVCDTANEARICDQRYKLGAKVIKIDHHPNEDPYGDLRWIDTAASSCSEMIYEFYLFGKDRGLTLPDSAARLLFAGIVGDTGRFLYPSTSEKTFQYASELVHYKFSRPELFNAMYDVPVSVVKLQGYVLQHFEILEEGAGKLVLRREQLEQFGVKVSDASQLVSSLGGIKDLKAWAFFIEEEDNIRVRLRSIGPVINGVAKKYNGGGHPLASGASIHSWDEVDLVMQDLIQVCRSFTV